MKTIFAVILISLGLVVGAPSYAANGDNKGQPFQELKAATDAALAAEAAAREAADSAQAAALAAEEAARMQADSAMAAALALEQVARMQADLAAQAQINAHAGMLQGLGDRVSHLFADGLILTRSITWEETTDYDVVDLAGLITGLHYQPDEWILFLFRNAVSGTEFGLCTNNPKVADLLAAVSSGSYYQSGYTSGSGSFFYLNGTCWQLLLSERDLVRQRGFLY
jgi:hypothetical protein